jgi:hypothetical protein
MDKLGKALMAMLEGPSGTPSAALVFALVLWLLLVLALIGCNPMGPSDVPNWSEITHHWEIGRNTLVTSGWLSDSKSRRVRPEDFTFKYHPDQFMCGGELADGCFTSSARTIGYNVQQIHVIQHEAGHAILYALHDDRWKCYGHGTEEQITQCKKGASK